jgi:hypothetical protein
MKQMFKFFVVVAAVAACMIACSSEEIVPDIQPVLERANLTIFLNNNDATTKAVDDENAVVAETTITSISLFVFGPATKAEADTTFTAGGSNPFAETANKNEFKATFYGAPIGKKNIYIGVNLPENLHNTIRDNGVAAIHELNTLTNLATLYPASDGFPMFSDGTELPEKTIEQGKTTQVNVNVKRFVAKVTLETASTFETDVNKRTANGATVDKELTFAMGQINTKIYPFPKQLGNEILDPNYSATITQGTPVKIDYQADFINAWTHDFQSLPWPASPFAAFKQVTASGDASDITKFEPAYIVENTSAKKLKGELTYAAVKAKFTPEYIHTYIATKPNVKATQNTLNDFSKLYVFDDGGVYYYFTDQAEADAYKADKKLAYATYTDCICFYTVYLNPKNSDTDMDRYNVHRNDYYKVKVDKIARLGNPYPGPDDPTLELGGKSDLEVTIKVQKWNLVLQSTILGEGE